MPNATDSIRLDSLDGFEFEKLCKRIFEKLGYGTVIDVQDVADEGRDLVIEGYKGDRAVVECKHQPGSTIGRPVVQKLHSATLSSNARFALLMTTGRFSKEAIDYAKKLQDISIELIDLPLLNDLAERAGIRLLKAGESSPIESLRVSDSRTLVERVKNSVMTSLISAPTPAQTLGAIEPAFLDLRTAYRIQYNIHQDFATSIGRIHSVHANNQVVLVSGKNGDLIPPDRAEFLLSSQSTRGIDPGPPGVKVNREDFKLDLQTLTQRAKQHVIALHTKVVTYYGGNNVRYEKACEPGERSVFITNITQLYYPYWRLSIRALRYQYKLEVLDKPQDIALVSSDLFGCKTCGREITVGEPRLLCNACGAIAHRKKSHGFLCENCKKTVCRSCTFWTRKWLILKKKICEACADSLVSRGKRKRKIT